jgi:hypothetical protein
MTVKALRDHRDALLEWGAASLDEGGILAVPYTEGQEQDATSLLLLVLCGVRARGGSARLIYPLTHPLVAARDLPWGYLLIHQATRIAGALEALEQGPAWWRGRVVVATGPVDEWGCLSTGLPMRTHPLPHSAPPVLAEEVDAERGLLARYGAAAEAYALVAAFDAFSVALPLSLLARTLGLDEDRAGLLVEQAKGLLYWIERERPAGLLVSTKGELVAQRTLKALHGQQADALMQESHQRVLQALSPREAEERHVAIGIFQALVAKGKWPWARRLAGWEGLYSVLAQATVPEDLAWKATLANLDLPELAARAFQEATEKDTGRTYLLPGDLTTLKGRAVSEPALAGAVPEAHSAGISPLLGRALEFAFRAFSRLAGPGAALPEAMGAASRGEFSPGSEAWREGELEVTVAPDRRGHLVATCEAGRHPCQGVEVVLIEVAPDLSQHIRAAARTDSGGRADLGVLEAVPRATRAGQYLLRLRLPEA